LVGNCEGKKPLASPRCRCEFNIKIDLQEVEWGAWIGLVWLKIRREVAGSCECGKEILGFLNCWEFFD